MEVKQGSGAIQRFTIERATLLLLRVLSDEKCKNIELAIPLDGAPFLLTASDYVISFCWMHSREERFLRGLFHALKKLNDQGKPTPVELVTQWCADKNIPADDLSTKSLQELAKLVAKSAVW